MSAPTQQPGVPAGFPAFHDVPAPERRTEAATPADAERAIGENRTGADLDSRVQHRCGSGCSAA